jgi:hypothetical protein
MLRRTRFGWNPAEPPASADQIAQAGRQRQLARPRTLWTGDVPRLTHGSEVAEFRIPLAGLEENPVPLTRIGNDVARAEIRELGSNHVSAGGYGEDTLERVGDRPQARRSRVITPMLTRASRARTEPIPELSDSSEKSQLLALMRRPTGCA